MEDIIDQIMGVDNDENVKKEELEERSKMRNKLLQIYST